VPAKECILIGQVWKVRQAAYEDLSKDFSLTADENDPIFDTWSRDASWWKGVVGDSNVFAQEAGLGALITFLQFTGTNSALR
jgi:hypothetical protein